MTVSVWGLSPAVDERGAKMRAFVVSDPKRTNHFKIGSTFVDAILGAVCSAGTIEVTPSRRLDNGWLPQVFTWESTLPWEDSHKVLRRAAKQEHKTVRFLD